MRKKGKQLIHGKRCNQTVQTSLMDSLILDHCSSLRGTLFWISDLVSVHEETHSEENPESKTNIP